MLAAAAAQLSAAQLSAAQVTWPQAPAPRDGDARIAAVLATIQDAHRIPAIAAAVVRAGGLQAVGVVGWRKLGDPTPARATDQWHLGSNTKAMTATLAARLVERGLLRWDTTVGEVLPEAGEAWRGVTLDQLLAHRAGTPENLDWSRIPDRVAVAHALIPMGGPLDPPGAAFRYSNTGYVLAGAMLERRGGRRWEELIADEVWRPLHIAGAGFGGMGTAGQSDQPWGHHPPGVVVGNGPAADNPLVLGPAGTAHMPLADWARFIADQLSGALGESALLTTASYRHLHEPWSGGDYARGWIVLQRAWAQGQALTHAGSNTMHYAVVWMAPRIDLAVLVCCNQGDAAAACDAAVAAVLALYLP